MARRKAKQPDDTWSTKGPDPIELIARFLVGTSYRVPVEGKGSKPLMQTCDVASAVGYMTRPLERATAVAVATRAEEGEIARLSAMAYRKVLRAVLQHRARPLDLRDGADRWRLRIVTYDAAYELVWPERRRPYGLLARDAKMRKASYIAVHRCATSVLQEALNNARRDFGRRLWGED